MFMGLIVSSVLTRAYGLENLQDQSQDNSTIALGYVVLVLVCVYISGFNVACG